MSRSTLREGPSLRSEASARPFHFSRFGLPALPPASVRRSSAWKLYPCLLKGRLDRLSSGSAATPNGLSSCLAAEQAEPLVVVIVSLKTNVDVPLACVTLEQVKHQ
jgi:hypothetical protein